MKEWMRSPWQLLPLVVVLAALLAVAGCGGAGGGQEGSGGGGGSDGNNLVIGYDQEPPTLNPLNDDALATSDMVAGILQGPYLPQPDLSLAPQLAEGEPRIVSEDPFTVEYTLKEGLTWSDGEPLTSADARFTYDTIMDPDSQVVTREGWDQIESFETPDERTVRMVFSQPYAPWRDMLSGQTRFIIPEHVYADQDLNAALNDEVVGSGPFQLGEWNKGENLVLERNENYWGESPTLDSVTIRFIPDTNSLITALQSGEISFINPPPDVGLIERLEGIEGAQTDKDLGGTTWEAIHFNLEEIDNLQLRQAVAYGINRQQILEEILSGQGLPPLQSVIVPDLETYYTPAWEDYTYDPDRARQLVEEAVAAGADPTITFSTTSGNALRETLQEVVQQQLEEVGITVEIQNFSAEEFFGDVMPGGRFQMGEWAWVQSPDPQITQLFGANDQPPDGQNYYRYESEEVTSLLEQSDRAIDEGERADLLRQAQERMVEDMPIIPLYQRPVTYAFSENLSGPQVNSTLAGPFWNIGEWSLS